MAVGDALGLPYEGLSAKRGARLFGEPDRYRFFFGRGMISDDTEHACLTAQALIASAGDPEAFLKQLGKRIRWWFAGVSAGLGKATLKSSVRLWLGVSPHKSGVNSAGNGGIMRTVILGAAFPSDRKQLAQLVQFSTRATHRNAKAELGSWIIALAAAESAAENTLTTERFREVLAESVDWRGDTKFQQLVEAALASVDRGEETTQFAKEQFGGRRVSGYILQTTPVVIHAWLRYGADFATALKETIRCGGDTDTIASVVGGLIAARHGRASIPEEWLAGICEWPRTIDWIDRLGDQLQRVLQTGQPEKPLRLPWWGLVPRNLFFLSWVLVHAIRRALPPY